jgi:LEA14-like dessication related protein
VLIIDVPVIGRIRIPLDKDGEFPIPQKPDVDLESVKFNHLDLKETQATLHLKVDNYNPFDLGVNKLNMDIRFGDVSVGQATYDEGTAVIEKGSDGVGPSGVGRLQVPITLRPRDFGSASWDIMRGRSTGYTLKGHAEVDTPFGPMQLPFVKEGGKTTFKNKDEDDDDNN